MGARRNQFARLADYSVLLPRLTTGTTTLALLPVLTSTGRGADIMIPMAIPIFGGMTLVYLTMFTVPVLYALVEEWKLKMRGGS